MISSLGHYFLLTSLAISLFILIIQYILPPYSRVKFLLICSVLLFCTTSFSLGALIYSFIESNFKIVNVIEHSHTNLPFLYKMSASWGNHEGSMLLWTWIISFYNFIFCLQSLFYKINSKYFADLLVMQNIIQIFFLLFLCTTSNPFLIYNLPVDNGTELTPVLQDPILAIHPPLIYFGYLAFVIIITLTLTWARNYNTISLEEEKLFFKMIKIWSLLSWTILTLGITLGSWWAYYELGWGGWWFWDPVENSSLMPWLAGLALLHTVQSVNTSNVVRKWTYVVSCLGFLLSIAATFFVRSGFLESVHSFATDSSRGIILLTFILATLIYMVLVYRNMKFIENNILKVLSKVGLVVVNNIYLILVTFIILFATIYPSIYKMLFNTGISIGELFFESFLIPLIYSFLLVMAFVPSIMANSLSLRSGLFFVSYLIGGLIACYCLISSNSTSLILTQTLLTAAIYIFILFQRKSYSKTMMIAHLAFCMFITMICLSSLTKSDFTTSLSVGEIISLDDKTLLLRDFNYFHGLNFKASYLNLTILESSHNLCYQAFPEKKFFYLTNTYITKPYILSNCLEDLYIVLGEGNFKEGWSLKIHKEPFMMGIWFSGILFCASGIYALFKTNKTEKIQ